MPGSPLTQYHSRGGTHRTSKPESAPIKVVTQYGMHCPITVSGSVTLKYFTDTRLRNTVFHDSGPRAWTMGSYRIPPMLSAIWST
ncbi:MAG: hypothetical protein O2971_19970 [Proteobacteria bacterium]|nr:hypothetical protein [Pseudomonadota bacterium]